MTKETFQYLLTIKHKTMKSILLILLTCIFAIQIKAQRQNVNSFTTTQQQNLACNIKSILDNYHEELIHRHTAANIHNTPNFLVWHRFYIHKIEKYLHSNFNSSSFESNPLPYWNPLNVIPNPFFNTSAGVAPLCDRANNPLPPHTDVYTPLQFQNINVSPWGRVVSPPCNVGRFNCTFNGMTTKSFFDNVISSPNWICGQASTRDNLTTDIGSGAGHHGNVHLAIGGCLGGDFHQAPASTLFSIWHSYLDKIWYDWEVNCQDLDAADLYIPDRENDDDLTTTSHNGIDMGYEPNEAPTTYPMWVSDDIWLRNQQDGIEFQEHENPEYSTGKKVYVYVRVRNRGGAISSGNEQLKLYWAKAGTSLDYPNAWTGSNTLCTKPSGGQVGTSQTVTSLQPLGYKIYVFEFVLPNPNDYNCVGQVNHFCLLARITDASKPNEGMTFAETNDIYNNVRNNNNIAWKNISIFDNVIEMKKCFAGVTVRYSDLCKNGRCLNKIIFRTPFVLSKHNEKTNILKYGKIQFKLSPTLLEAYKKSNAKIRGAKIDKRGVVTVNADYFEIPVLLEKGIDNYSFNIEITKLKRLPKYLPELKFDVYQETEEKKIIGGQRFVLPVNKYKPIKK